VAGNSIAPAISRRAIRSSQSEPILETGERLLCKLRRASAVARLDQRCKSNPERGSCLPLPLVCGECLIDCRSLPLHDLPAAYGNVKVTRNVVAAAVRSSC